MLTSILNIIGLKVVDIRGFRTDRRIKHIEPQFILFSDRKTYLVLEEQDSYTYHDCDTSARTLEFIQNEKCWIDIYKDLEYYPKATEPL